MNPTSVTPVPSIGIGEGSRNRSEDPRVAALIRLLDVALQLANEQDLVRILRIVTIGVCDAVDCERASLFLLDEQSEELYTQVVTELEISEIRHGINQGITGWVARHREVLQVPDPHVDERWDSSVDRRTGFVTRNILAAPVVAGDDGTDPTQGRLVGVLQLLNKSGSGFTAFDEQLIRAFAAHAATALERRRLQEEARMAHQLEAAMEFGRRIQKGFLPEALPSVPGYEVASWWQPAEFVSGDYYDWFQLSNGQMAFVIGDVSGHGLGPSLIMASLRAMLHVLAKTVSEPDRIVDLVSESIMDDLKQGHFVTFLLVTLNPSNHEARFANAGHAPALHLDAGSGVFSRLKATRLPLGLPNVSPAKFDPHVFLLPGDLIVMGTDGCIEVHNEDDDMFGTERLEEVILEHHHKSADEIVAAVRDAVQAFHGRPLPPDDSTLMIIKRKK